MEGGRGRGEIETDREGDTRTHRERDGMLMAAEVVVAAYMGFEREMTDWALGRGHQEKEEKGGGRERQRQRKRDSRGWQRKLRWQHL